MTFHTPATKAAFTPGRRFIADGGFETAMIFLEGLELPAFSSVVLLETDTGREAMRRYFDRFLAIAKAKGAGFLLDTATWRAGPHWADAVGRSEADLGRLNAAAVDWARALRDEWSDRVAPILVNGAIGPSGDGYAPDRELDPDAAECLHSIEVRWLATAGVDMISAVTMTHTGEAIGIARAAKAAGLPCVVSFTVETDGRLPNGQNLAEAIAETDAATDGAPIFFVVNCAHPDHFVAELGGDGWLDRIGGVRANASRLSHAELDEAEELDDGDPEEFGALYGVLATRLPNLRLIGGCCGSDHRHVAQAAARLSPMASA